MSVIEGGYAMDQFSSKHFAIFILATTVVSLKTYPTVYTLNGLRDSWIAMIISSFLILLYLIYVISICQRKNSFSLNNVFISALGDSLGKVFLALFGLTLFITLVEAASLEADSMHVHMLSDTPVWFFIIFFIGPTLYTVKKDLAAIVIVSVIGITLVTISGINLAMLTARHKTFSYLFPVFENGITLGFWKSIIQILGLYGSIAITFPYLSKIKKRDKLLRHSVLGLLFVIQMQIVSLTGIIQTFDIKVLNQMYYPNLLQTQLVSQFRFLEAGELFVMLQIVGGWYLKYIITFFALLMVLKEMKIKFKYLEYYISGIVAICAYVATNSTFRLHQLLNYYTYIALVGFVIIPFIVFTIFAFKGQKATSNT